MRPSILYIVSILTFIVSGMFAQNQGNDDEVMGRVTTKEKFPGKTNFAIKTDVLTPAVNYFFYNRPTTCLSIERGFACRHAIQITGQRGTFSQQNYSMQIELVPGAPYRNWTTDVYQTRAALILDYKYFWKDSNYFKGFYCGLYVGGITYTNKFRSEKGSTTVDIVNRSYHGFCGGATIGYQIILKEHFVFDFLFGLGVRNVFLNPSPYDKIHTYSDEDIPAPLRTPPEVDIRTTINIGYKF
jgi:hypothetical protein